jgi:hypothetical protein
VNEEDVFSKHLKESLYFDLITVVSDFINNHPNITYSSRNPITNSQNFRFDKNFNELKTTCDYLEYLILKANGEINEKKDNVNLVLVLEKEVLKENPVNREVNRSEGNELLEEINKMKLTKEGRLMHSNFPESFGIGNFRHVNLMKIRQKPITDISHILKKKIAASPPKMLWKRKMKIDIDGFASYIKAFWPKDVKTHDKSYEEYALEYLKMNDFDIGNCMIDIVVNNMKFQKYIQSKYLSLN